MLSLAQASLVRSLSLGDEASIRSALSGSDESQPALDARTAALVRLACFIARDAAIPTYQRAVQRALDAGVSVDEMLLVLLALAEPAGSAVVVAAAPKLAMALGYDVEASLEELST